MTTKLLEITAPFPTLGKIYQMRLSPVNLVEYLQSPLRVILSKALSEADLRITFFCYID
ncbi:hypothetical protein FDUTEX481_04356 [Tolypothrix sp. PCC 7601]|nr:hypothetical protein FDUTEX481_04356 [Tolypothrix sp. PCC 7601]